METGLATSVARKAKAMEAKETKIRVTEAVKTKEAKLKAMPTAERTKEKVRASLGLGKVFLGVTRQMLSVSIAESQGM